MKLFEFLRDLEAFYPLNESEEKVNKRLSSYVDILEGEIIKSGKAYDYEKVLKHIQMNYRYKQFPSLPDILDFIKVGEIEEVTKCEGEGSLVVVTLPNGYIYPFEVSGIGKPIEYYKDDITRKYGKCDIKVYPKGSVLIGREVITP